MNILSLAAHSALSRRRGRSAIILLSCVCAATVAMSLAAGDSVRSSLKRIALERLGRTAAILDAGARPVFAALVPRIEAGSDGLRVAAIYRSSGTVDTDTGRLSGLAVHGIDDAFFAFAPEPKSGLSKPPLRALLPVPIIAPLHAPRPGHALLNRAAADRLGLKAGTRFVLSVPKADTVPLDLALSGPGSGSAAIELEVDGILEAEQFGSFSLAAVQAQAPALFMDRESLARACGQPGRATLLLARQATPSKRTGINTAAALDRALAVAWDPIESGFSLSSAGGYFILRDEGVFFAPEIARDLEADLVEAMPVASYFLDSVDGTASSPFAFAAGVSPRLANELFGNEAARALATASDRSALALDWLASDAGLKQGSGAQLRFRLSMGSRLESVRVDARIAGIVAMPSGKAELARALMPLFPGMSDAASCSAWDPGIPLDLKAIRPKDEAYWKTRAGTPKLYLDLSAAEALWGGTWGSRTAYVFPPGTDPARLSGALHAALSPKRLGLSALQAEAFGAAGKPASVDFASLFLGLSMFLLASPLIVIAILFALRVEDGAYRVGLYLALGFGRPRSAVILLLEGAFLAVPGALIGLAAGAVMARLVLAGLNGPWSAAAGGGGLGLSLRASSLATAGIAGIAASLGSMALAARRYLGLDPAFLLSGRRDANQEIRRAGQPSHQRVPFAAMLFMLSAAASLGCAAFAESFPGGTSLAFFSAGAAALIAGLSLLSLGLNRFRKGVSGATSSIVALCLSLMAAKKGRTLAAAVLAASSLFVIAAVGANAALLDSGSGGPLSGSGGFESWIKTDIPFRSDEAAKRIRDGRDLAVFKYRSGDDASCLNLAHGGRPFVLGADPASLLGRFSFIGAAAKEPDPWSLLDRPLADGSIPAIADSLSLEWNLGLSVGNSLALDGEHGTPIRFTIVAALKASVFQGGLIVSDASFSEAWPSESGYRLALLGPAAAVQAPVPEQPKADAAARESAILVFSPWLPEAASCRERLAAFARVELTYLEVFYVLGAAGLFLGLSGFAALALLAARQEEGTQALFRALGLGRRNIFIVAFGAQFLPLLSGCLSGCIAAWIALIPAAARSPDTVASLLWLTLCALSVGSVVAAAASLPGRLGAAAALAAE